MASRRGPPLLDPDDHPPLPLPLLRHHHPHPHPHPLEERLAAIDRQIQALLLDNQRLAAVHVALRQELLQSQQDLRAAAASASRARQAKDADLRDALDRARQAEAAARRVDAMRADMARVAEEVRRLSASRDDMVQRLVGMRGEIGRMHAENAALDAVAKDIDAMRHELQKGRAAIEFEKKAHADNEAQRKHMDTTMLSMAREIDKLRAELANTEKRAQATANPGYPPPGSFVNPPEPAAYASSYADPYKQVQRTPDGNAQFVPATDAHYTQHPPAQR